MIKNSAILFLGAGQIGRAACVEIVKRKPKTLILHALTDEESKESLNWIKNNFQKIETELIPSSGDILAAYPGSDTNPIMSEFNYRFGTFTSELYQSSQLWKLIEKFQPDMIADGINTATVVGYGHDPFTASRELIKILEAEDIPDSIDVIEKIKESLLSEAIPPLIRFVQVLHRAMIEFEVKRYVKISTSGLGGMGFNLKYTHGDIGEPGCSPKLLGKVAAAGIFNQLIWTLSRTPGLDIKMIIPTALVGWDDITTEVVRKTKRGASDIPLVDCKQPLDLTKENIFSMHRPEEIGESLKMAAVDSGENGFYGIGEMTTITTLGQMGCITKEEVGIAVAESLEGSTKYDICTALDSACLGPSFNAAFERNSILAKMKEMDETLETSSVAIGNLGPKVTKHLWELEILRIICSSLSNIVNSDASELAVKAEKLILHSNITLRRQILSLQMPILLEENRILLGAKWHFPKEKEPQNISENIEAWAQEGWVDLRAKRMTHWQREIKKVFEYFSEYPKSPQVRLQCNWRSISLDDSFNIGEVLGFIYSISGGYRKLY